MLLWNEFKVNAFYSCLRCSTILAKIGENNSSLHKDVPFKFYKCIRRFIYNEKLKKNI